MESIEIPAEAPLVLVVDDSPEILKVLVRTLKNGGYRVLSASDGKTAIELMAENPDLVLQDLILPDISGYDLVSKLRAHARDESLPILALSGFLAQPEGPWDKSAGFDALLVKPISSQDLLEAVKTHLKK
jgi:CheY-like chemotaxis protein